MLWKNMRIPKRLWSDWEFVNESNELRQRRKFARDSRGCGTRTIWKKIRSGSSCCYCRRPVTTRAREFRRHVIHFRILSRFSKLPVSNYSGCGSSLETITWNTCGTNNTPTDGVLKVKALHLRSTFSRFLHLLILSVDHALVVYSQLLEKQKAAEVILAATLAFASCSQSDNWSCK